LAFSGPESLENGGYQPGCDIQFVRFASHRIARVAKFPDASAPLTQRVGLNKKAALKAAHHRKVQKS